jgi:hypothetical protein
MNAPENTPRDEALRAMLVATVTATATATAVAQRPRWRRLTPVLLTISGLLAGGAAGAAITAAANPASEAVSAQADASLWLESNVPDFDHFVGHPIARLGHGSQTISVGTAPAGATQFSWTIRCTSDSGTIADSIAQVTGSPVSCHTDVSAGITGSNMEAGQASGGSLTVTATAGAHWVAYYGWATTKPLPSASAAQLAATDDGIITRSEYVDAYNRFAGCMYAHGDAMVVPETTLFIDYAARDEYAIDWCYAAEFEHVDQGWQLEHPRPSDVTPGDWGSQTYDPAKDPKYGR